MGTSGYGSSFCSSIGHDQDAGVFFGSGFYNGDASNLVGFISNSGVQCGIQRGKEPGMAVPPSIGSGTFHGSTSFSYVSSGQHYAGADVSQGQGFSVSEETDSSEGQRGNQLTYKFKVLYVNITS